MIEIPIWQVNVMKICGILGIVGGIYGLIILYRSRKRERENENKREN